VRFLVDECTGPTVARWLREEHEVFSVHDEARGAGDDEVIERAFTGRWISITNDKDFGGKIFKEHRPHCGVVFLRLQNERTANKIKVLRRLLEEFADELADRFVVVNETQARFSGNVRDRG